MGKTITRTYALEGDNLEIEFRFDEFSKRFLGDYPDFEDSVRYTPRGSPWVNVTSTGCPYAEGEDDDCGGCRYLKKEEEKDLIGICTNKNLNKNMKEGVLNES